MKKLIALLLALALVIGLVACAAKEESAVPEVAPESSPESAEKKKITIMWPETDSTQVDVMENYIQPALAEKFPDVEIEYIPMTDLMVTKTLSASGDLPDIWYTGGEVLYTLLAAGDCLDLAQYVDASWVEENFKNPSLVYNGDAIYFLHPGQDAYYSPVFYYNKAIFEANGISVPNNIDELVAACQKLVDAGVTPITTASWTSANSLIDGIISSADPEAFKALSEGSIKWTDNSIRNALGYFDQLKLMGAFAADIPTKEDATAYAEFQSGAAAMLLTYSWFNGDMVSDVLGFEAGSFSFPNSGDDYVQLIFAPRKGCWGGYTANAHSADPELLAEIMKVIVEVEANRHNINGVSTNFKAASVAEAPNDFEAARYADYDRAKYQISSLYQANMDGVAVAEYTTLYNMLMSADMSYLSEQFIDELQPVWDANIYAAG